MTNETGGRTGKMTRRGFLGAAGAAGLGSALLASGLTAGAALAAAGKKAKTKGNAQNPATALPRRKFGRTGVDVTELSMGGMTDFTENQILLNQAWKLGLNYWDTSTGYNDGKSELGFGQFFEKHPGVREKLFVVTKCGDRSPKGLEASLD
ncbi:MAG: aldo/keto reductase, partial [bacterium]